MLVGLSLESRATSISLFLFVRIVSEGGSQSMKGSSSEPGPPKIRAAPDGRLGLVLREAWRLR